MSSKGLLGTGGPADGPPVKLLWLLTGPEPPLRELSQSPPVSPLPFSCSACNRHPAAWQSQRADGKVNQPWNLELEESSTLRQCCNTESNETGQLS